MPKPSITEATDITAEVVLELGKYHSAQELRNLQAKLTSTSRELRGLTKGNSLLARIGEKLSFEQLQLLQDAAKLIESVNANLEHAKEKRQRREIATKALQKDRDNTAKKIVNEFYPLPCYTTEQKLSVIRLALALNRIGCFRSFCSPMELSLKFQSYIIETSKFARWATPKDFWEHKISSIRDELRDGIENHIADINGESVRTRFDALRAKAQTIISAVPNDPYEIETLRLWSQALSPATTQEGSL